MGKHHSISLSYSIYSLILSIKLFPSLTIHIYSSLWAWYGTWKSCLNICCTRWTHSLSLHSILFFPLLLVIMKLLILIYCYYDESHNVLDTMEVFPYVDLIIIKKLYDFLSCKHIYWLIRRYRWRSVIFIAGPFFLLCTCYNRPTFILTDYERNA